MAHGRYHFVRDAAPDFGCATYYLSGVLGRSRGATLRGGWCSANSRSAAVPGLFLSVPVRGPARPVSTAVLGRQSACSVVGHRGATPAAMSASSLAAESFRSAEGRLRITSISGVLARQARAADPSGGTVGAWVTAICVSGAVPSVRGPVFDLVASKLRRPLVRQGTVLRSSLIERLAQGAGGRSFRWWRRRDTARRRSCRSGPSVTARRSPGCRSMTGTTIRRSCSLISQRRSMRSSRSRQGLRCARFSG